MYSINYFNYTLCGDHKSYLEKLRYHTACTVIPNYYKDEMEDDQKHTLKAESELRCQLGENESLTIVLSEGNAEIFGVELVLHKPYKFKDENIAIFTWYGCTLITSGACRGIYEANETTMVSIVNTHVQLEARRDVALANGENGPRVMT